MPEIGTAIPLPTPIQTDTILVTPSAHTMTIDVADSDVRRSIEEGRLLYRRLANMIQWQESRREVAAR